MSEEIKNEDVVVTDSVEEATVVAEPAAEEVVETPVVEEAPAVEEAKTEEPAVVEKAAEEPQPVITNNMSSGKKGSVKKPGLGPVENGAIGSAMMEEKPVEQVAVKTTKAPEDTVAIRSTKNVVWQGVGKVVVGVNIVPKAEAEQWLTRNHVTLLSPEDVAKEYNK